MYNLCRILQHIVDGFDDVSLAQHHPVIERYQLVFHVHAQSGHQLYAILKEKVKQLLRYVTFVCEQLAIQSFGENLELNTFGSLSLTFAPVSTKAIISPLSLHARCSLKP